MTNHLDSKIRAFVVELLDDPPAPPPFPPYDPDTSRVAKTFLRPRIRAPWWKRVSVFVAAVLALTLLVGIALYRIAALGNDSTSVETTAAPSPKSDGAFDDRHGGFLPDSVDANGIRHFSPDIIDAFTQADGQFTKSEGLAE